MHKGLEFCQITRIYQRLQVFVEHVKIADSEDVWFLCDASESAPKVKYLIPKENAVEDFLQASNCYGQYRLISTLRLSVNYPYRINIEQVGWLYSGLLYQGSELGETIAFNTDEVSYRLDPLKHDPRF